MELKFVGVSIWLIMCGAIKCKWLSVRGISFRNWHLIFVQISWPLPYSVCRGAFSYYKLAAYHVWEKRKNNYFIVLFLHKKSYVPRALSPLLILGYGVERDGYIYISVKHVVDEVIYQGGPCKYGCCSFRKQPYIYRQLAMRSNSYKFLLRETGGVAPYWTLLNFKEQSLPNTTQETKKETKKISKITQSCLAITATESLDLF